MTACIEQLRAEPVEGWTAEEVHLSFITHSLNIASVLHPYPYVKTLLSVCASDGGYVGHYSFYTIPDELTAEAPRLKNNFEMYRSRVEYFNSSLEPTDRSGPVSERSGYNDIP